MNFKDAMIFIATPILVITLLFGMTAGGSAAETDGVDWYFKPNQEHLQPEVVQTVPLAGRKVLYCGSAERKAVTITFDAGYDKGTHAGILKTLKEKQVQATFFLDGNFVKQNGPLVQQMAAEGHTVGNHSLNHADMTKLTDFATYSKQITGWNDLVQELGITPSTYFRYPCGRFSARALDYNERLGLTSVFWSFAYYDWVEEDQPDPEAALEKIMGRMHNGCVLLLHSTSATNEKILGTLIDRLRAEGYEILPINEMTS